MNFLRKLILGDDVVKQLEQLEQKAAPVLQAGVRYEVRNGVLVIPSDNKTTYVRDGYSSNDIIYSVFNLILDKVRLPEWHLFKVVDESSLKQYRSLMSRKDLSGKEHKQALQLRKKALEEISKFDLQSGKLNELLKYPNECDTFQNLITDGCGFKLVTGDLYFWADLLKDGANTGIPNSIWNLPSQYMMIKVARQLYNTAYEPPVPESYELTNWNYKFAKETILHDKYWNPNWDIIGQQLHGFSPLKAFLKNMTRNNAAKDASSAKFQNGGLDTIIYFDDQRFTGIEGKQQAEALKIKLAEEYSGPSNQGKYAVSGYKVGTAPLGMSPVELGIIDSEKWDAIMFCNGYGVPPELLGLTQKTYNNAREAEKALTTRSAIPLLTSGRNALNRKISTDWGFKDKNIYIDYSTECFTELEADLNQMVTWLKEVLMISPDEQREQLGLDSLNIPESKETWVKTNSGYVPLSDFQANAVDAQLMQDAILNGQNGANNQRNSANGNGKVPTNGVGVAGLSNGNGKTLQFTKSI